MDRPQTEPTFAERMRAAPVTFALTAINVAVFVIDLALHHTLVTRGWVQASPVVAGEYWRLATYMFFHGGWVHLLWNAAMSVGIMANVEGVLGKRRFLFAYLVSGIGGGAASVLFKDHPSVGASGAMFGVIGMMLALRWRQLRTLEAIKKDPGTRSTLFMIVIWTAIGLGAAESGAFRMDHFAHFGGLFVGGIVAWIMTAPRMRKEMWTAFAIAFLALLVFAMKPWNRGEAKAPMDPWAVEPLVTQCQSGVTAACYAYELTMPLSAGDTTRDLEPRCNEGDQDACGAWGWTLAHGRPGVVRDEARGRGFMKDACEKGSAWSCKLAKGARPDDI